MDDAGEIVFSLLGFATLGLGVWSLYDIFTGYFPGGTKGIWVVLCLLLPLIGPVLYLLAGRRARSPA